MNQLSGESEPFMPGGLYLYDPPHWAWQTVDEVIMLVIAVKQPVQLRLHGLVPRLISLRTASARLETAVHIRANWRRLV